MPVIRSQCTILDNIDFGERGTEFLLQNVPTVLYKIVVLMKSYWNITYFWLTNTSLGWYSKSALLSDNVRHQCLWSNVYFSGTCILIFFKGTYDKGHCCSLEILLVVLHHMTRHQNQDSRILSLWSGFHCHKLQNSVPIYPNLPIQL